MTARLALAALSLAAAMAAGPVLAASAQKQCFLGRKIDSWAPADAVTVNLRAEVGDYYQLKLLGDCRDIDLTFGIAIEHRGSDWICEGQSDAVLIVPTQIGPRRCPVVSIRKMTRDEVKALPSKQRP